MIAVRANENGYTFDYAGRTYNVWRHRNGHIVYKWNNVRATYPRNAENALRVGSAFSDAIQRCVALIKSEG